MFRWGCRLFQSFFGIIIKGIGEGRQECVVGEGTLLQAGRLLERAGKKKPLVITGKRVSGTEFFSRLIESLPSSVVFCDVVPDPTCGCVGKIAEAYREKGCDSMIAIGGGSNMDAAKAAGALIVRPGVSATKLGGLLKVRRKTPFLIAVPTTAGTGSECTVAAVVTDEHLGKKFAINDPHLMPDAVILDPSLTYSLSPELTAMTGMDALTHAVEAYLNRPYHLQNTAGLCEEAVASICRWLPVAYNEPENAQARKELLLASYKAGRAFTVACVGNVHALAHTAGGQYHVPHGKANAVFLPYVLERYLGSKATSDIARLACAAGLICKEKCENDIYEEEEAAALFINHIRNMNRSFGIEDSLPMIGEDNIPTMALWACREANPLYPVPVIFSRRNMEEILRTVSGNGI